MGNPPDQQQIKSLIKEGLRQLRAGKVSAAIKSWEEALALDPSLTTAQSYIDYIKKNRIRIAVHLGRTPPLDDEPIDVPESWPEPPAGLCDPITDDDDEDLAPQDAGDTADYGDDKAAESTSGGDVKTASGHLPYAEVELSGASQPRLSDVLKKNAQQAAAPAPPVKDQSAPKAPPAPRPPADEKPDEERPSRPVPTRSPTGDDYIAMEIVVEDDEAPADPRTLPPPPEALDAPPEMIIEAPKQDSEDDEQKDYLYDRASSEQLEGLSLERLAGKGDGTDSSPKSPAPPAAPTAPSPPPVASDDAPTEAREHTPSGAGQPKAEPTAGAEEEGSMDLPQTPRVATTFDEVATNPRADPHPFSQKPPGGMGEMSPYTTLAGLGPRVLFAEFGDKDLQGEAPPLEFAPPPGEDAPSGLPTAAPQDDYEREQGSFSEDAPTRAMDLQAKAPEVRMDAPADFDREEGSFSDEIPTQARASSASPETPGAFEGDYDREQGSFSDDLPTRARPSVVEEGAGVIPEPGDFTREGSFSDDIPTQARTSTQESEAGIRAMPLDQDFRREGSFSDELATLERDGEHKEERLSEELEALLHPDRGLALANQLYNAGEFDRSLQLTEQLLERYPTLDGLSDLLEANRSNLQDSLLESLGDLESIPVPKTTDLGMDNDQLDPRAAFLFSRIDGTLSLQDIMDISGMSEFEAARILLHLREIGLLEFKPPR